MTMAKFCEKRLKQSAAAEGTALSCVSMADRVSTAHHDSQASTFMALEVDVASHLAKHLVWWQHLFRLLCTK